MTKTAAEIAQKRGRELFFVETIKTPSGKKYAIVSHREKIGQDKRIIDVFEHTRDGLNKATEVAKQYRRESEAMNQ